jgi:ferredoxin
VAYTSDQLPSASQNNRRSFLADIGRNVFKLIRERYHPADNTASHSPGHRRNIPHRLATVNSTLQSISAEVQKAVKAVLHPRLQISQTCTICPRCTGICPTGAISRRRRETDSQHHLVFAPERCTGCGLCVAFCEKHAIRLFSPLLSHRNSTSHDKDGPASVEHTCNHPAFS